MAIDGGKSKPDVVCFGMVTPAMVLVVEEMPSWNTGAIWSQGQTFISDDAAIIAILLRKWDVQTGLICTTLGDDDAGRDTVKQLEDLGIQGEFRLSSDITTPFELNVSDRKRGGRTYFWKREPKVLETLDEADLSLIKGSKLLYLDWYDGDHIMRALKEARNQGVPVYLNIEHGHEDPDFLARYAPYISICQAVTDASQLKGNAYEVASNLLELGLDTVLVTMADQGCLAATRLQTIRVHAPIIDTLDGCAAGATFSAGFQYGFIKKWDLEHCLRFAVAAASLQCTVAGPTAFPLADVELLGASLDVEVS